MQRNKNKGFTLVELVVTMMILSIMLAISVMSLTAWQDWSDFNRVNEYAETMFLAAQNQLSEYKANGTLPDFSNRVEDVCNATSDDEIVHLDSIYYLEDARYTELYGKDGSDGTLTVWTTEKGTIVSIRAEKGDYERYKLGGAGATKSQTAQFVFELLQGYIYDQSLLNDTICIEFSLEDGQVFSVLYSDKFTRDSDGNEYECFVYTGAEDNIRGMINISKRYDAYRKERMLGYYGVDSLSKASTSDKVKPTIADIKLNNEDTLNLTFKLSKHKNATTRLNYDITVYDADTADKQSVLKITLNGAKLKNYANRQLIECPVVRWVYDAASDSWVSQSLGDMNVLAWLEEDNTIKVILDAADVQATADLYKQSLPYLTASDQSAVSESDAAYKNFLTTYSFHRFGLSAEHIYCTVQGYGSMYKTTSAVSSTTEAVYFADYKAEIPDTPTNTSVVYGYDIANGRHLYNMRYVTDLSFDDYKLTVKTKKDIPDSLIPVNNFKLVEDVDWTSFAEKGEYYDSGKTSIDYSSIDRDNFYIADKIVSSRALYELIKPLALEENIKTVKSGYFASFKQLGIGDTFDGDGHTITGLRIRGDLNEISFVYGPTPLTREDDRPAGMFVYNYGSIANLTLDNIRVNGIGENGNKVGAFCGINVCGEDAGILRKLEVKNTGMETVYASVISGNENVGGITGYLKSGVDNNAADIPDVTFEELTNEAKVTGNRFVGGIVGEVRTNTSKKSRITITKCTNKGAVIARDDSSPEKARYIGGITGYVANVYADANGNKDASLITISDCVSTPEYSSMDLQVLLDSSVADAEQALKGKLRGVYVGGIVGYNYFGTVANCSTQAEQGKTGYVFGYMYVGGIVGYNEGPSSGIKGGKDKDRGVNEANVIGCMYVGGITGCNADKDDAAMIAAARADGIDISDQIVIPDRTRNPENKIEQWINKGIVFSTDSYAGGITGYNAGWLYNCSSEVENSETDGFFQLTYSGDYSGGIAGYNNGIIGNTNREKNASGNFVMSESRPELFRIIPAVCYVTGSNYVGGVVGYNDIDAIVEDYAVVGGHIRGREESSIFVGGYAGLNASVYLLQNEEGKARVIMSNPNEVTGLFCVGGSIGGNVINTHNYVAKADTPGTSNPPNPPGPGTNTGEYVTVNLNENWPAGEGYVGGNLKLALSNTSGEDWIDWEIVIPYNDEIEIGNYWGCTVEKKNNMLFIRAVHYTCNVKANEVMDNVGINIKTTQDEFDRIKASLPSLTYTSANAVNLTREVSFDIMDMLFANGGTAYGENCMVETDQYSSGEGRWTIQLFLRNFDSANVPREPISNWSLDYTLPAGCTITSVAGGQYVFNENILSITPPANSTIGKWNSYTIVINVTFDPTKTSFDNFDFTQITWYEDGKSICGSGNAPVTPPVTPPTPTDTKRICAKFETDNFLGEVRGTAFIGGFIGYNLFVDSEDDEYANGLNQAIAEEFEKNAELSDYIDLLDNLAKNGCGNVKGFKESDVEFYLEGDAEDKGTYLGGIYGDIYLGGVIGYNDGATGLYIKNVTNATPITAYKAIEKPSEQNGRTTDYRGDEKTYLYSYTGGIIGKVSAKTTLDNCANKTTGVINADGTYIGGLCEINEGKIINCAIKTIGSGMTDYVAGLCGLNKKNGIIQDCDLSYTVINGRNMAAGIAVENFGKIVNPNIVNTYVQVSGRSVSYTDADGNTATTVDGVCGAVTAYNAGEIILDRNVRNVNLRSKGNYVGAIAGINTGKIINNNVEGEGANAVTNDIIVTGNIIGYGSVGGFIGLNKNEDTVISNYVNKASVTADYSLAGGIVGENEVGSSITNCENYGVVTAKGINLRSGEQSNAGGITAFNDANILNCNNYAEVKAPNGMCGGITATNGENGLIENCSVMNTGNDNIEFTSKYVVGGIAAVNSGTISWCKLKNVTVVNYPTSGNSRNDYSEIGVVVGRNTDTGVISLGFSNQIENCNVRTYTNFSRMGGVAGINYGNIHGIPLDEDTFIPVTKVICDVGFIPNTASIAAMGGVAGANYGVIEDISVQGSIIGNLGSDDTGCGGIAGVSGIAETKDNINPADDVHISKCTFDGKVQVYGSFDNRVSAGGIVGLNNAESVVTSCHIGVDRDDAFGAYTQIIGGNATYKNEAAYSYIGGIVGRNRGDIYSCDNASYSKDDRVELACSAGAMGGIEGYGYRDSVVTGTKDIPMTSGKNWIITVFKASNDTGHGGIIGYTASGRYISYVANYANVKCSVNDGFISLGGIAGRTENVYETNFKITNCENYGNIYNQASKQRSGGFVGTHKYQGVTFENCVNYGKVGENGEAQGGFIGLMNNVSYDITFRNCINHGNIKNSTSNGCGGFVGAEGHSANELLGNLYFYNCVNTGICLNSNGTNVGGFTGKTSNIDCHLYNCRNYGTGTKYGFVYACSNVYMEQCLDVNGQTDVNTINTYGPMVPKVNKINAYNNYYLNKNSKDVEPQPYTYFTYSPEPDNFKYYPDPMTQTGGSNSGEKKLTGLTLFDLNDADLANVDEKGRSAVYNVTKKTITFNLMSNEGVSMRGFKIYLTHSGRPNERDDGKFLRTYTCTATFKDMSGNTIYTHKIENKKVGYWSLVTGEMEFKIPDNISCKDVARVDVAISVNTGSIVMRGVRWLRDGSDEYEMLVRQSANAASSANVDNIKNGEKQGTRLYVQDNGNGTYDVISRINTNLRFTVNYDPTDTSYYSDKNEYTGSATRIKTYEDLDPKYFKAVYSQYNTNKKLTAPVLNSSLSITNSNYVIGWSKVDGAYAYDLTYQVVDKNNNPILGFEPTTVRLSGETSYAISQKQEWYKAGYKVYASVRAISAYNYLNDGDTSRDSDISEKYYDCLCVLPIPEVHLELLDTSYFIAVLANPEDYMDENGNPLDCTINVRADNKVLTIKPQEGIYSKEKIQITTAYGSNMKVTSWAVPGSSLTGYAESSRRPAEVGSMNANDLTGSSIKYSVTVADFYGITPDDFEFRLTFNSGRNFYLASDIIGYDDNLGIDISYGHGITYNVEQVTSTTALNNLNYELLEQDEIKVLTYLWKSQTDALFFGHEVEGNISLTSKEDIKYIIDHNYLVEQGGKFIAIDNPIWDDANDCLKNGYIVFINQDGNYDIVFSKTLEMHLDTGGLYQVWEKNFKLADVLSNDFKYYTNTKNGNKLYIQPKPVIEGECIVGEDSNGHSTYTFKWDNDREQIRQLYNPANDSALDTLINKLYGTKHPSNQAAKYQLILIGTAVDGSEVTLETVEVGGSFGNNSYTFVDEQDNWNYKQLNVEVTRIGVADSSNKTTYLPQTAKASCRVKLKLTTLANPQVALSLNEKGTTDKNNLNYDVTFTPIIDPYELDDLGGYLIKAEQKTENPSIVVPVHYYYIEDIQDTTLLDKIDIDETELGGIVKKLDTYKVSTDKIRTVQIDLSDFNDKDDVDITVQAITRKNAATYMTGSASTATRIEIPNRIKTVSAEVLAADKTYDAAAPVAITDLNNEGIKITVSNNNDPWKDIAGSYQIAIAVYDDAGKAKQDADNDAVANGKAKVQSSGDRPDTVDDRLAYWNDGAFKTFVSKADEKTMTKQSSGKLDAATYTFKLTDEKLSDYAGMWLKIAIRATSDNMISSWWSDEDADDATVNYMWVRIPKVSLDTPELKKSTANRYCGEDNKWDDTAQTVYQVITNPVLKFKPVDYAECYIVKLLGSDGRLTSIYIEKQSDGKYKAYYVLSDAAADDKSASQFAKDSVLLGTLSADAIKVNEYSGIIPVQKQENAGANNIEDTEINLLITMKDGEICIVLPDADEIGNSNNNLAKVKDDKFFFTQLVTVQAIVSAGNEANYQNAETICWKRTGVEPDGFGGIKWKDTIFTSNDPAITMPTEAAAGLNVSMTEADTTELVDGENVERRTYSFVINPIDAGANPQPAEMKLGFMLKVVDSHGNVKDFSYVPLTLSYDLGSGKYIGSFYINKKDYIYDVDGVDTVCKVSVIRPSDTEHFYKPQDLP